MKMPTTLTSGRAYVHVRTTYVVHVHTHHDPSRLQRVMTYVDAIPMLPPDPGGGPW